MFPASDPPACALLGLVQGYNRPWSGKLVYQARSGDVPSEHCFRVRRDPGVTAKGDTGCPTSARVLESGEVGLTILIALAHLTAPTRAFKTSCAE